MDERNTRTTFLGTAEPAPTVLPGQGCQDNEDGILKPGSRVTDRYVITRLLNDTGAQALVYEAEAGDGPCVIKLYREGCQPSLELSQALTKHTCPFVVRLRDCGSTGGRYFEVYDYYKNGTLAQKGRCSTEFIQNVVVPDLNEGLHFLHTLASSGIVHGDLKPGNLFLSDDRAHILIGDFGISSYLENSGSQIGDIKGTPEYSPRIKSFYGKATRTPAYDYGSLGLVLVYLATGHSLFEGLNLEQISRAWEEGIHLPDSIDSSLRRLISGLLLEDESKRFGYQEVKRWCDGQYIESGGQLSVQPEMDAPVGEIQPMIFGLFDMKIVTAGTRKELAQAMVEHWQQAKKHLKRSEIYEFLHQFDPKLEQTVRELSQLKDEDHAVFLALYRIFPLEHLYYRGKDLGTVQEFIASLEQGGSSDAQELLGGGLFEAFLRAQGHDEELIEQVHTAVDTQSGDLHLAAQQIYYLLSGQRQYVLNDHSLTSLEQLIDVVVKMDIEQVEKLAEDKRLLAWLVSLGYRDQLKALLIL